jgi:hypothetical protein
VKLIRNVDVVYFVLFKLFDGLTRFSVEIFRGEEEEAREQKQEQKTRAIDLSLHPSGFTPAFGRVEAATRRAYDARAKEGAESIATGSEKARG